jgi:glycerol-3-phosphate dehydrogenase
MAPSDRRASPHNERSNPRVSSPQVERSQAWFPAPWRASAWARAAQEPFDLIVVGGGITGAGIARDAALRGMRVGLFDRGDFGNGTSSRSSRLVHGGVRYLEHGHLHLVLESSRERRRLLRIAPHLVRPLAFTWPVYAGARIPLWKVKAGLTLYDALAFFRNVAPHKRLAPDEVLRDEPHLLADQLRGGARYYDAAADDARLVLANVIAAAEQGSVVLNYAAVEKVAANNEAQRAWRVDVRDAVTGALHGLRAHAVVFALGPWSDGVAQIIGRDAPSTRVLGSIGAHIAVDRRHVNNAGALTLLAPADGRVFFVLPADDLTIITTTESPSRRAPQDARASRADVNYLLNAANHYFPAANLGYDDIVAAWAGVRPLVAPTGSPNGESALSSASREHSIVETEPRLFLVTGGKLTTFRAMAEEVVDRVGQRLPQRFRDVVTHRVPLPGGDLPDLRRAIEAVCRTVGDQPLAERLVHAYGSRWPIVIARVRAEGTAAGYLATRAPYLTGEANYSVEHELAMTLADVLIRRMRLAFEQRDHGLEIATQLANALGARFGWTAADVDSAIREYQATVERQFTID